MSAYFNGMVLPMNSKQDGSSGISTSKPSPIVSSEIRHVWQSDEYKDKKALDDMKIWVQTDFAWYILEHPSKDYIDWYIDCWLQHQIWLAISYTSKMAVASIQKFKAVLNRSVIACAERDFQKKVTMRKIETFIPSILQTITEAAQESYEGSIKLAETGFFRLLCAEYAPHLLDFIAEDDNSSDIQPPSPLLSRPPSSPHPQPKPPVEFESGFGEEPQPRSRSSSVSTQSSCDISRTSDSSTIYQEYPTFCTPLVRRLSQPYLPLLGLQEKGADDSWEDEHVTRGALSMDMSQREYVDIGLPKFTPPVSWDREGIAESTCLRWVDVDAQRFQPNDTVYVYFDNQRGQVLHIPPADLPKHIYIALILYLYLDKFERPKAHVIYFEPASNTSLGNLEEKENDLMVSLAHPQELILSNDCAEVHVTQFFGLCDNTYLVPGSPEPSPRKDSISYFYRYFWIAKDDDAFIDAKLFLNQSRDMVQTKSCPCCGNKDPRHCTKITPDGVVVGNTEYHINDFAYIQHEQSDKPYIIGQMLRFYTTPSKTIKIQYRRYYRPKLTPEQSHNDRLLTFDDSGTQYSIDANRLEGKCFVIPLAEDSQDNCLLPDDCFVCDFPPFVRLCRQCGFPDLPQKTQPLRGLDLFSGAGGLSIGLESTGVVETGWAVERDESAAKTFQKNHKDARVYNMCINRLLSEVYAREHQSEQLDDSDLIDFPRRGEVDIVFGGPPCTQSSTTSYRPTKPADFVVHVGS
ncbi:hypothetical protein FRC16_009195 [Serendipita sp. 398]|nr:hypothetical protein FRC16_009195 [Serendipita sp. 398]